MNNEDFINRLRNKEIANRDQVEGERDANKTQEERILLIRSNAKNAFESMSSYARQLVADTNGQLEGNEYVLFPIANGFCIKLGNQTAGFTYSPTLFANVGVATMAVLIQQQISNFGAFGLMPEDRPIPTESWRFSPDWDRASQTVIWVDDRGRVLSSKLLVEKVMEELMDRNA